MNWTAQQRIRVGFWLLAFVPIVLGVLAAMNARELADSASLLEDTNELSRRLEQLFSDIKDVEVAQREYVLMGGDEALQTIRESRDKLDVDIKLLRKLGASDLWLTYLDSLIPQKFEEIDQTINLRDQGGPEAASQVLLANRGRQAMDDIRMVVRNMVQEQERRLQARKGEQRRRFIRTLQLFAVILFLNVGLLAVLYLWQRRETERVRLLNEELERRVGLRTEALQRSNEDLQQFAYVASHDMREPLRMISSYTTLLQRRYSGRLDDDADTFMQYIVDGVRRMNTLIQNLLDYSRAGAGKDDQLTDVDVNVVLRNVMANLRVTIAEAGGSVLWDSLPQTVPYDSVRLTQIFQNLVGNALKYRGDRRPVVEIKAETREDDITFRVSDNGIGIEPEYIDKIFDIFQRLHGKEYEGTGIGLAMVKKIVERYGGRIWVESTPGIGSTFYFTVLRTAPTTTGEALTTTTT